MKALFLDRDGVINEDYGYVHQIEDFVFKKGIFSLARKAIENNFSLFIVTNQAGIARGFYTEDDFLKISEWLKESFLKKGALISDIYYCPHHPEYGSFKYKKACNCRKPSPQMFLDAKREYSIDMEDSIMIGDNRSDLIAAETAGVKRLFLLGNHNDKHCKYEAYIDLIEIERALFY